MRFSHLILTLGLAGAAALLPAAAPDADSTSSVAIAGPGSIPAAESKAALAALRHDPELDALVAKALRQAVAEAGQGLVAEKETWATVIDCRGGGPGRFGGWQGSEPVYPASVVKLCYMLCAFAQMEAGSLADDAALRADLKLMIRPSDNKATNRIVDRLTGTETGPELPPAEMAAWEEKRLAVVRYLESVGLSGLYAANKTFDGSIPLMGRDKARLGGPKGDNFEKSNMLTTDGTARLLYLVWKHAVVSAKACDEMLELMHREVAGPKGTFRPESLPAGMKLHAKFGNTGICRHDAAIFEEPDGKGAIIAVVFTKARGAEESSFPAVVERTDQLLLEWMRAAK